MPGKFLRSKRIVGNGFRNLLWVFTKVFVKVWIPSFKAFDLKICCVVLLKIAYYLILLIVSGGAQQDLS